MANRFVAAATTIEHPGQHGDIEVGVVVHAHVTLAIVEPVQPTGVLVHGAAPGHGQCQQQRVQPRIVEPVSDVRPDRVLTRQEVLDLFSAPGGKPDRVR